MGCSHCIPAWYHDRTPPVHRVELWNFVTTKYSTALSFFCPAANKRRKTVTWWFPLFSQETSNILKDIRTAVILLQGISRCLCLLSLAFQVSTICRTIKRRDQSEFFLRALWDLTITQLHQPFGLDLTLFKPFCPRCVKRENVLRHRCSLIQRVNI